MLLLGIEKAFDTVWHRAFVCKLKRLNIPDYIVKLMDDYLRNRTFTVKVKSAQSSVLAPTLFLMYINDLPKHPATSLALFADDTAVFSSSRKLEVVLRNIQKHIMLIEKYYKQWKIKINTQKTSLFIFTHKKSSINTKLTMYGKDIQYTSLTKYLGLYLDPKLIFSKHITQVKNKTHAAISILYPLISCNSFVSEHNELNIYKICTIPLMVYACHLWSNTFVSNYKKLQILQNKCLRMIKDGNNKLTTTELHSKYNLPTIKDYVRTTAINFFSNRLNKHSILHNVCKIKNSFLQYKIPDQLYIQNK